MIPSPLLCQPLDKPGHRTGVVYKHTDSKNSSCCDAAPSAPLGSLLSSNLGWGCLAQRTAQKFGGKAPRPDLYPPLSEKKREISSRPGSVWEESEAGGKKTPAQRHGEMRHAG